MPAASRRVTYSHRYFPSCRLYWLVPLNELSDTIPEPSRSVASLLVINDPFIRPPLYGIVNVSCHFAYAEETIL